MKNQQKIVFGLLLMIILFLSRLPGLKSFVAVDEPAWLTRGANFYYALAHREFENTIYEYHPSVTTMWFVATATFLDFPEYRGLGQGYFDVDKEKFDPFLLEHGRDPLQLLYMGRLFQVIVIVIALLFIYYFLSLLFGNWNAFLAVGLAASAPYFLGHSRALSHEGMVAVFVLASITGLMAYLEHERKWIHLFISAAFAALAQLTKSSAIAMMPLVGLMLLISMFLVHRQVGMKKAFLDHGKIFGLWLLQLGIVYFLVWPGMWVAPGEMLYEVYGNAFGYAFQGARLDVIQELEPSQFHLDAMGRMVLQFFGNLIRRSTPLMWLGMIISVIFVFTRNADPMFERLKKLFLYLVLVSITFIVLFSSVQGRNSAHYIMTSHVSMDLIASFGWCILLAWLGSKWKSFDQARVKIAAMILLLSLQLLSARPFFPYYYNYYNPMMTTLTGETPLSDYGEGFEQAALYLSQKPNAAALKVLSFRGRGPFSYFFPGQTILLNPLFVEEPDMASLQERLNDADYLVINAAFGPRTARTQLFVDALEAATPEHEIRVKGVYTIYIYKVADLPASFYDVFSVK
jgi:hypothetical protein